MLLPLRNVTSRLGCGKNGARDIHNHSWFLGLRYHGFTVKLTFSLTGLLFLRVDFDWDACLAKRIPAPWIPTLKSPFDTSNFEHTGDDHDPMPYTDDGTGWDADF